MNSTSVRAQSIVRYLRHCYLQIFAPGVLLRQKYQAFRRVLQFDDEALGIIAELEPHIYGNNPADHYRIKHLCDQLIDAAGGMVDHLLNMNPAAYRQLGETHSRLSDEIRTMLVDASISSAPPYILQLDRAAGHPRLAGGKAANLAEAGRAGVTIPPGFVITANAFHRFLQYNTLEIELVKRFQSVHADDHDTIIRITGELQENILGSEVPFDIAEQIEAAAELLRPAEFLAVRSSALAEDGRVSFAGQYASELDVPIDEVVAAYKRVIAGKYCPRAIAYRIRHGLSDADTAMAVLVVPMITPFSSGVVYTCDPASGGYEVNMGVYAVAGLADALVDGLQTPEKYHINRDDSCVLQFNEDVQDSMLLGRAELMQLRNWGLKLEAHFGCPQDIEWALDGSGLTVLQSRRLQQSKDPAAAIVGAVDLENLLYSDLHCAAAGISCGPVFLAPTGKAFQHIPPGSVVVTPNLRPSLSQFLDRTVAVIASSGSRASHLASVAREMTIPVVVGAEVELTEGQVVTVDAASGRIFRGCVNAVLQHSTIEKHTDFPKEKYARLAASTTHLGLLEPDGEAFTPRRCMSMHDIVRFCHEMGVREMFSLVGRKGRGLRQARKLATELPLVMYVLDLDNLQSGRPGETITLEQLSCLPMQACWKGISDPRIYWDVSQSHVDWEEFDALSGGIFSLDSRLLASYAVVSRRYLHLNIRFGYHFSIVDAFCDEQSNLNYVNFRFKGGGANQEKRLFRLDFIDQVLTAFGFEVVQRGDMLDATLCRVSSTVVETALTRLGMLLAITRMMDMRLKSIQHAAEEAEKFILFAGKEV